MAVGFGSIKLDTLMAASHHTVPSLEPVKPVELEEHSLVQVVELVDELYLRNKMKEALTCLEEHGDSQEAEILWRLARLCYKVTHGYPWMHYYIIIWGAILCAPIIETRLL